MLQHNSKPENHEIVIKEKEDEQEEEQEDEEEREEEFQIQWGDDIITELLPGIFTET